MIYLDYCATTPVDKRVLNTFNKVCIDYPGNSNSLHKLGADAHELEEYATDRIKKMLQLNNKDIIYTSGASESNNQAIKGICFKYKNRGKHIITTYLEHSSIISTMKYMSDLEYDIDYVKIDKDGRVDLEHLKKLLRNDTVLVSICMVDSELGIRQPIEEISKILKDYPKCFFHVDCTQALGKIDIDFNLMDLASISMHKIYGMKGIGMLIKNSSINILPLIHGGKSSTVYRAGTPALPLIVSSMKAIELAMEDMNSKYKYVEKLNNRIMDKIGSYDDVKVNSTKYSISYVINISLNKIKPETFVHAMDEYDIYLSTKSACSDSSTMSDAVYAVVKDRDSASHSIRISLSYKTEEEEIDKFLVLFEEVYRKLNFV
ncbi:MAG: cysteine desulfurase family protein [Bacilli bacterium]|nr:cysteine desulfurase family protein [Bacilli bacterium]